MSTRLSRSGQTRHWLVAALAVGITVLATMAMQGCCKSCCPPPCPAREHAVVVYPHDGFTCAAPAMTVAKKGEWVLFINATQEKITIKAPVGYPVFAGPESNQLTLEPGDTKKLQVSSEANVHQAFRFAVEPELTCPTYPGPGMDVED